MCCPDTRTVSSSAILCCSPYSDDAPCVSLKQESPLVMSHSMPSRFRNIARQIRKEVWRDVSAEVSLLVRCKEDKQVEVVDNV